MLPSSSNKIGCNVQTCSNINKDNEDAELATSSIEQMPQSMERDKGTQVPPVATSPSAQNDIPNKTSEKSTETYFDRNYENIRIYLNKFCLPNSSETSPTESQMSATILKSHPPTNTTEKSQSWHQTLTIRLPKCTCKRINKTPSSSISSLASEYLQKIKLFPKQSQTRSLQGTPAKKVNISDDKLPQLPQILQTETPHFCFADQLKKFCAALQDLENSEESESEEKPENLFIPGNPCIADQYHALLQLVREVENIINKDSGIQENLEMEVAPSSSKKTAQDLEMKSGLGDKKVSEATSTMQPDSPLWLPQPCCCNCRAHMPSNNFSFPPFNLTAAAAGGIQEPGFFVHEENNNFKNAAAADQLADNVSCLSFAAPDPLEYNTETSCPPVAAVNSIKTDVSVQTDESLCLQKDKSIQFDASNKHNLNEEIDDFKDCSSDKNNMLMADHVPIHLTCQCLWAQSLLKDRNQTVILSCLPAAQTTDNDPSKLTGAHPCSFDSRLNVEFCQSSLETEAHVDEMFPPPFDIDESNLEAGATLEKFSNEIDVARVEDVLPSEMYRPCSDCLMEYDDEEPNYKTSLVAVEELKKHETVNIEKLSGLELVDLETPPAPLELAQAAAVEMASGPTEPVAELAVKADVDHMPYKEFEEFTKPEDQVETGKLIERSEFIEREDKKTLQNIATAELATLSNNKEDDVSEAGKPVDKTEESDASPILKQEGTSSPHTSETTEIDKPHEYNGEDEHELAKEKSAESDKGNKPDEDYRKRDEDTALVTAEPPNTENRSTEMKFFIDSLILDLEAMDYARRKSQFEKNICKPKKLAHCSRESFPVTITDVTDLGANSLYVKWKIHDCFGIVGYEIYTDGYLTNRFYNSRHEAAVITHVDITLPHRIALVAQTEATDASLDSVCNMSRQCKPLKSLPWRTAGEGQRPSSLALWTPSIFLYDPRSERAF